LEILFYLASTCPAEHVEERQHNIKNIWQRSKSTSSKNSSYVKTLNMDKASKKDLVSRLFLNLKEYYLNNGFTYIKTGANRFEKNELMVYLGPSAEHIDSLIFRPGFRVHNIKIGKVLKKLFPEQIGIEITIVRLQSLELCEELGIKDYDSKYIYRDINGSVYSYQVEKETNLDPIVADHINFLNLVGFPFFAKVDTLEGINDFLNNRILQGDLAYFQSEERIKELKLDFAQREVLSGVTTAYLLDSPHIEELLHRYRIFFAGNNYVLEPMEKVVDYFNNKSV
jgi:hypothetical protein